jgi:hypothetical protein
MKSAHSIDFLNRGFAHRLELGKQCGNPCRTDWAKSAYEVRNCKKIFSTL